jgi:hypothetical protein
VSDRIGCRPGHRASNTGDRLRRIAVALLLLALGLLLILSIQFSHYPVSI